VRFEHFALNVPDAPAMACWYVAHLGFQVVRRRDDAPFTHFLADDTGKVVVELYSNPAAPYPDYGAMHPLVFHFAVFAPDARSLRARLEQAGAQLVIEETPPDGSVLIMLRDPWGVALQLCQRAKPFPGF
jgi:glyoxylase I family protein